MLLTRFAANLKGPWMIDAESAQVMLPVLKSILSGVPVSLEPEEKYNLSELIAARQAGASSESGQESKIHILHLQGTMFRYDNCGMPGSKTMARALRQYDQDPSVIGHIIVADSGGGAASAVSDLAEAIRSCSKPVVGFIDGTAASACIYTLSYCQKLIAHQPMNFIGCVGVMVELFGFSRYHKDADGEIYARIYADQSSEKNLEYEQALEGNASVIKETCLNPLAEQFIQDMKANRPGCTDDLLKGKTYFAKDVIGSFIDSLGTLDDAVAAVAALASPAETEDFNRENMKNYKNLMAIACLAGQAIAEDGSATLNPEQLEALDKALGDALASAQTVAAENTSLKDTIAKQNSRNAELEASLTAAIARANNEAPDTSVHSTPAAPAEIRGAETHAEAAAACAEFLKNFKNI